MASNAKRTKTKRRQKAAKTGKDRKKQLEKKGTTRSEAELFGNTL